ncbi:MAG: Uncharacterised protein [Hyphomonas sp. TMED17]|nr:MAG: Uncharacterised protein [Hyphomonas sp. TMED17]
MPQLFDTYIVVDWSAAAKKKTGANSIWIGTLSGDGGDQVQFSAANPATRLAAREQLLDIIQSQIARGQRVLIGFDFCFGYPAGTAAAFGLRRSNRPGWEVMHQFIAQGIEDRPDNANNRFKLAAELNAASGGGPHPFWGVPKHLESETLSARKGAFPIGKKPLEFRITEHWIKQRYQVRPKTVWQLLGAGAVGSQALMGIPTLNYLRSAIPDSQIWPFETGFTALDSRQLEATPCVFAEIYPSTLRFNLADGDVLDRAQVHQLAYALRKCDHQGQLGKRFGPPADTRNLPSNDTYSAISSTITDEEGWILAI